MVAARTPPDPGCRRGSAYLVVGEAAALVDAIGAPGPTCTPSTAHSTQTTPSAVTARRDAVRCPPTIRVSRSDRQRHEHEDGDGQEHGRRSRTRSRRVRPIESLEQADRGAEVAPVGDRVERPVERRRRSPCRGPSRRSAGRAPAPTTTASTMPWPGRAGATQSGDERPAPRAGCGGRRRASGRRCSFGATRREPDQQGRQHGRAPPAATVRTAPVGPGRTVRSACHGRSGSPGRPAWRSRRSRLSAVGRRRPVAAPVRPDGPVRHSHHTSRPNDSASSASATASAARR